jgi:hypothetical protein
MATAKTQPQICSISLVQTALASLPPDSGKIKSRRVGAPDLDLHQRTGVTSGCVKAHGAVSSVSFERRSPAGRRAYAFFKNLQLALS